MCVCAISSERKGMRVLRGMDRETDSVKECESSAKSETGQCKY